MMQCDIVTEGFNFLEGGYSGVIGWKKITGTNSRGMLSVHLDNREETDTHFLNTTCFIFYIPITNLSQGEYVCFYNDNSLIEESSISEVFLQGNGTVFCQFSLI